MTKIQELAMLGLPPAGAGLVAPHGCGEGCGCGRLSAGNGLMPADAVERGLYDAPAGDSQQRADCGAAGRGDDPEDGCGECDACWDAARCRSCGRPHGEGCRDWCDGE